MGKTLKNISPRIELWVYQYVREQLAKGNIEEAKDTILQTVVKPHLFGSYMNDKGKNECREALMDPTTTVPVEWDFLAKLDPVDELPYWDDYMNNYKPDYWDTYDDDFWWEDDEPIDPLEECENFDDRWLDDWLDDWPSLAEVTK